MESAKGRILCVHADRNTRNMMKSLADLQDYELILAQNVAEGLTASAASDFDLILLDWHFEDGTGVDLCKKLRTTGASAPILFYADNCEGAGIEEAMLAGAQGLLIRPLDSAELLRSLSGFTVDTGIKRVDTA